MTENLTQRTIAEVLLALRRVPGTSPVRVEDIDGSILGVPVGLFSYRGYYERLAFEVKRFGLIMSTAVTADMLTVYRGITCPTADAVDEALSQSVGDQFVGYKGGAYTMDDSTLMHVSNYGETGPMVVDVAVDRDGYVVIVTAEEEF